MTDAGAAPGPCCICCLHGLLRLTLLLRPCVLCLFPGTGKTATFAVGILQVRPPHTHDPPPPRPSPSHPRLTHLTPVCVLQRLDTEVKQCQALVLAPTRELALQIQKVRVRCSSSPPNLPLAVR